MSEDSPAPTLFDVVGGEPFFRALDKRTGETVFEMPLPAPLTSQPMSYALDGRQHIAVPAGPNILAFRLVD